LHLPNTVQAVIFDLNGVITTDMNKALEKLHEVYGASLTLERLRDIWRPLYIEASLGRISPDELWQQLRQHVVPGSPALNEEELWLSWIHLREPDMAHTLARLKEEYLLGVMSNHVGRWARSLLERFDLMRFLDAVLISSDIGVRKPDTVLYQRICQLLGVSPCEALYVADEEEDLRAAQAVGMFPVFIPGEDASSHVGVQIDEVADLLCILSDA